MIKLTKLSEVKMSPHNGNIRIQFECGQVHYVSPDELDAFCHRAMGMAIEARMRQRPEQRKDNWYVSSRSDFNPAQ